MNVSLDGYQSGRRSGERLAMCIRRASLAIAFVALTSAGSAAQACMGKAPAALEDIKDADVVVIGRIANYTIVLDQEMRARMKALADDPDTPPEQRAFFARDRGFLGDYAKFDVLVDEVLMGSAPKTLPVAWDNSTFSEPESTTRTVFWTGHNPSQPRAKHLVAAAGAVRGRFHLRNDERRGSCRIEYLAPLALPHRCVLRKPVALHAHDTEPLAGRRAHDDPSLHALVDRRAEFLEAGDFGRDVVGLDIEVDAAFMLDTLDLDIDLVRLAREHDVVAAGAWMIRIHRTAQRLGPETRGRVDVIGLAVDLQAIEARTVHLRFSPSRLLELNPLSLAGCPPGMNA
jgi:hypothetical protein